MLSYFVSNTRNLLSLIKFMEIGPSGETGENVQGRVAVDSILVLELAPILLQGMVGRTVLENLIKLVLVIRSLVQVQNTELLINKQYPKCI